MHIVVPWNCLSIPALCHDHVQGRRLSEIDRPQELRLLKFLMSLVMAQLQRCPDSIRLSYRSRQEAIGRRSR